MKILDTEDESDIAYNFEGPIEDFNDMGSLVPNLQISVWFSRPFMAWYSGTVTEVYPRRTVRANVKAEFEDGMAELRLTIENYGQDQNWVIPKSNEPAAEADGV